MEGREGREEKERGGMGIRGESLPHCSGSGKMARYSIFYRRRLIGFIVTGDFYFEVISAKVRPFC